MCVVDAAVVVAFEPVPGLNMAAVWDGGRWCHVHVVDDGRYGPAIESWDMTNGWSGTTQIPCTPNALRELVEWRLADRDAVRDMVAFARPYVTWSETRLVTPGGAPQFSAN